MIFTKEVSLVKDILKFSSQLKGLFKPKSNLPVPIKKGLVQKLDSGVPIPKTYTITKKQEEFVHQLQEEAQASSHYPVRESSVIRALLTLAATDNAIRKKLNTLTKYDDIVWGRPRKENKHEHPQSGTTETIPDDDN
jgi:hypothetical protein